MKTKSPRESRFRFLVSASGVRAWALLCVFGVSFSVSPPSWAQAKDEPVQSAEESNKIYSDANDLAGKGQLREALVLLERIYDPSKDNVIGGLPVFYCSLLVGMGDFTRAEPVLLRMAAVPDAMTQPYHKAAAYRLLGWMALQTGDAPRAVVWLERAIEILGEGSSFADVLKLLALDTLAQTRREMGEPSRAEDCVTQMRSILRDGYGGIDVNTFLVDLTLGEIALARGDVDAAERPLHDALDGLSSAAPGIPEQARVRHGLGVLATRQKDYSRARVFLEQALAIEKAALLPHHPDIQRTLGALADLSLAEGKVQKAIALREEAADIAERSARLELVAGSEGQKRARAMLLQRDTDALVSLHAQNAPGSVEAARLVLRTVLRRKGIVLDAVSGNMSSLRKQLDNEGRALFDELSAVDQQLSNVISRGPVDITPAEHEAQIGRLEARRKDIELRLATRVRGSSASNDPPEPAIELSQIQQAIPKGAALLEMVQYRPYTPFGPPVRPTWGEPRFIVYILRHEGDPQWVDLGPARPIEKTAQSLLAGLADPKQDPKPDGRKLDDLVMAPIRKVLREDRWILLSPDGILNMVPFYALIDETGHELIERSSFTYLTSGRDLVRRASPRTDKADGPLVVAAPDFGPIRNDPTEVAFGRGQRAVNLSKIRFPDLPATRTEGELVSQKLPGAMLLEGEEATEERIKAAHGPRVLHIATHGFFLPNDATTGVSGGRGTRGTQGTQGAEAPRAMGENPLLRAGLALYGANRRRSVTDEDDGVLTALEISALDLRGTELVVLSACETGVGEAERGEGVYGLRRALVLAGAETEVMSLWQVDDEATRDLMVGYYSELAAFGGRSEGLRRAQLRIRASHPHPYYWASFIVAGNGAALGGASVRPDFSYVAPRGPRGCACRLAEDAEEPSTRMLWPFATIAAFFVLGARRTRRTLS